ncbi:hypothetical protein NQ314_003304 [Rhamnusium bicolor]|uniref:HTH CENPB-type domain-containing protein n=1 Tax=Rhamnusium bicolor TaxID=1586634 RepID=A0AAV8ZM39_9CUCU|nr:hypothetical protein NQ314_003304 [Rhamnusium bicolor]
MSIRCASRNFGVPRGTIQDRLHGRVPEKPGKMGPSTILTQEKEQAIVDWLISLAKVGFARKKSDLLKTVEKIIKDDKRNTPFKDGGPGNQWYSSFLTTYPILVQRTAESINMGRAVITEEYIRSWFTELRSFCQRKIV